MVFTEIVHVEIFNTKYQYDLRLRNSQMVIRTFDTIEEAEKYQEDFEAILVENIENEDDDKNAFDFVIKIGSNQLKLKLSYLFIFGCVMTSLLFQALKYMAT